jgi:uncharacterized protein YbjT (DUF2867 family)
MAHHWEKLHVEELLFESGLPFTILQPAPYMQNMLSSWKSIVDDDVLRVPYSIYSPFSFIDLADLAEAATIVLSEPGHRNAIYELAGTLPVTPVELADVFSHVLGHPVRAEQEEIAAWKIRAGGIGEYALENLVRMFEYYDRWGLAGNPNVLRWILKKEPAALEIFIRRNINPG